MQHMVGAKLDCALGQGKFEHNSYSTSDQQSGRSGEFFLGDVAIHVATAPGEAVVAAKQRTPPYRLLAADTSGCQPAKFTI
jgi:hypothetical protein